jgi:putative hydrolase of the HAD superfamily
LETQRFKADAAQSSSDFALFPRLNCKVMRSLSVPKAVLFDLFHTLASVPPPASVGEPPLSEILGVSGADWHRLYYEEDILGRCIGQVLDGVEAMRRVTHHLDPTVDDARILAAVESRRRRFELGLVNIERPILDALDRLRAAGIQTVLVSDAGADDVESWERSPLRSRLDAAVFSYQLGVRKPDPRIYAHAMDTIGVRAEDALFVGDGGSDEHRGARAVGISPVLVTRFLEIYWPERVEERRALADWEFVDVPAFVAALGI